jgi:peptide-methionine (R)-S-oxide reductase
MAKDNKELTEQQYNVCRLKGTDAPFSGKYVNHKADGSYVCVCCDAELFKSEHKYDSMSGWPSYTQPADSAAIKEVVDNSHGMSRTEVVCNNCGAHLGHVFNDGPANNGLRYCINSTSLDFSESHGKKMK